MQNLRNLYTIAPALSVYANVAYGPRIHGLVEGRHDTHALVEDCLRRVGLWDEVKDRLSEPGTDLSGGSSNVFV